MKCSSAVSNVSRVSQVPIPGGSLAPGATTKLPVWIQGHGKPGRFKREVLFYYHSAGIKSAMRLENGHQIPLNWCILEGTVS